MTKHATIMTCLVATLAMGCGDKKKDTTGDASDVTDVPDAGDATTDVGPDATPDGESDVPADEEADVPGDAPVDAPVDEGSDCVTGDAGSPPDEEMDACLKATSCITMPDMEESEFLDFCVYRGIFELYPLYVETFELFMMQLFQTFFVEVDASATCVAAAADCDEVFECLNGGATSPSCSTLDAAVPVLGLSCSGDVISMCVNNEAGTTNGRTFQHDCTDEGLDCVEIYGMGAGCMETDCTTAGDPTCSGRHIDWCIMSGAHLVIDCREVARGAGGRCGDADPSTTEVDVGCVPTGTSCDSSSDAAYCDGDDLMECNADFDRWVGIDCTEIGVDWFCDSSTDPGDCAPDISGWTCTLDPEPECDCDDVILCNPVTGADLRAHCPDYGFMTCGDTDTGTTGIQAGCID